MTNRRVIITLKGFGTPANHGVYDLERDRNQCSSMNIVIWVETANTASDTAAIISYMGIVDEAMAILTGTVVDFIETFAKTIASYIMGHEGVVDTEVIVHKPDVPIDYPFMDTFMTVRAGQTDAIPLSLSLKGVREAEDGSVLTGEIEVYGRVQAPNPAEQGQNGALSTHRDVRAAHAAPAHDATCPGHLCSRRVVLAIDGNLGDVLVTLMHTVEALSYMESSQIDDISSIMRTKLVLAPGQTPQPDYWSTAVIGSAVATPNGLFAQTSRIECELGHEHRQCWGACTVNIDIIQIGDLASSDLVFTLPYPRVKEHAFVPMPWVLYEPDAILEGVGCVSDLLTDTSDHKGIIDAVDDWLGDPAAVMADPDQLLALHAGQISAGMRELIEALTGEISQVSDLITRPGEPIEPVEILTTHTVIEDSGDDVERAADSESAPEQTEEPETTPISAAKTPAPCVSIWSRLAAAQTSNEASNVKEPEASEPELDESTPHGVDVPEAEAPAADAAVPIDETDATPQGEAPVDEAPTASVVPGLPHRQRCRCADEAKTPSRPPWCPVSSVSADPPADCTTRKVGTDTYKPSGTERPRWAPVFESKHEESCPKIVLPGWNFSVGAPYGVRVVDDHSGLGYDDEVPKAIVHASGRSTIPVPELPDNIPISLIPEEEATQTGVPRRVVVRPTTTGAIPTIERR